MLKKLLLDENLNLEEIKKEVLKNYDIPKKGNKLLEVYDTPEGDVGVWVSYGYLYLNFDNYRLEEPYNFQIDL